MCLQKIKMFLFAGEISKQNLKLFPTVDGTPEPKNLHAMGRATNYAHSWCTLEEVIHRPTRPGLKTGLIVDRNKSFQIGVNYKSSHFLGRLN